MRGIDRLGGDDRHDMFEEIILEPSLPLGFELFLANDAYAGFGQQISEVSPGFLLPPHKLQHFFVDFGQLLRRRPAIDGNLLDLTAQLACQTGDPDGQEFIEITARDREEAKPFEQRVFFIAGFGQDALVE